MKVLAIDPGTTQSAYVLYDSDTRSIDKSGLVVNEELCSLVGLLGNPKYGVGHMAIEMVKSYGNIMGDSVIRTCVWIGKFQHAWRGDNFTELPRKTVVTELCGSSRAKDSNVRQALIDLFCEFYNLDDHKAAIGVKNAPGPLYGVKKDIWSALAVAIVWVELQKQQNN